MAIENISAKNVGELNSQMTFQTAFCGFNLTTGLSCEVWIELVQQKIDMLKEIYINTMDYEVKSTSISRGFTH